MNERSNEKSSGLSEVLAGLISRLDSGNASTIGGLTNFSHTASAPEATVAQAATSSSHAPKSSSIGNEILNAVNPAGGGSATNILTSLFLGPLWKGIFSLFGGGEDQLPALAKYQFPGDTRTDVSASLSGDGGNTGASYDGFGSSRQNTSAPASINVSIQALDARSILDRSDDIAAALKQAMLSNHEINDNFSEL